MRGLQTKVHIVTDQIFDILTTVILAYFQSVTWALYCQLLLFFAFNTRSAEIEY